MGKWSLIRWRRFPASRERYRVDFLRFWQQEWPRISPEGKSGLGIEARREALAMFAAADASGVKEFGRRQSKRRRLPRCTAPTLAKHENSLSFRPQNG